jgi:hypothetical protein
MIYSIFNFVKNDGMVGAGGVFFGPRGKIEFT